MRFFDIFKKKSEKLQLNKPYLGDLEKTQIIDTLLQTSYQERDEKWQERFLENIAQASFRCGEPQVMIGPDGFSYFQLFLPEPNQHFQCFVIENMKDDFLLSLGLGVVINPRENGADWVLTYGDIVNYHLNKTFYTPLKTSSLKENDKLIDKEKVLLAQPSSSFLPIQARQVIAKFLKNHRVKNPKILLLTRWNEATKEMTQELIFNLTPQNFSNEESYEKIMQKLGWYLPRDYIYSSIDEKTFQNAFMPL